MITFRSLVLRKRLSSLLQSSIKNYTLLCQAPRISDSVKRFNSTGNKDPPADGTKDMEDQKSKEKYIHLELSILIEQGQKVPDPNSLQKRNWDELLKLPTKSARMKYYKYLFVTLMRKDNDKIKKQMKKHCYRAFKEEQAQLPPEELPHVVKQNRFLLRILERTKDFWRNNRLVQAMQFGDKLVFDCSYDQYMTQLEISATAKQLMNVFGQNRLHRDPFDLHFCNLDFNGETMKALEKRIPTVRNKEFPLNLHEESYLDLFPKEKLVYLTPDCGNDLIEYDAHSFYIVGAMVDKGSAEPLSLMKAKKLGLKTARLPLDKYVQFGNGFKSLTLDQMVKIMLDLKTNGDWKSALRHVPSRNTVSVWHHQPTYANKFKKVFSTNDNKFTMKQNDYNNYTLSTADKFAQKIRIEGNANTLSTADKFKKKNRIEDKEYESKNRRQDFKNLFSK